MESGKAELVTIPMLGTNQSRGPWNQCKRQNQVCTRACRLPLEALEALEFEDVLVTAPTGSGKTWIAREEIRRLLDAGKRAWYTTPLKALTNSKYAEFGEEFGPERVGILTGDRKENANAPL